MNSYNDLLKDNFDINIIDKSKIHNHPLKFRYITCVSSLYLTLTQTSIILGFQLH